MAKFKFGKKKLEDSTTSATTTGKSGTINSSSNLSSPSSSIEKRKQQQQHKKTSSNSRSPSTNSSKRKTYRFSILNSSQNSPKLIDKTSSSKFNNNRHSLTDEEENYDTDDYLQNKNKKMPSIHEPLNNHNHYDDNGYAVGGIGEPLPYKSRAPPHLNVTNPWNRFKIFDSPFPRYRHAASSITSEKNEIFIMGGLKDGSVFGDTWKIVPQENSNGEILTYIAENIEIVNNNNPPARVGHSSVLCGNAFIVYGGDTVETDSQGFPDNNFYLFNINNHKYTIPSHILNKPNGRYGHTIGVISLNNQSSRLYLFGGQLENDVFNDLYYFELNSFKSSKASWNLVDPLNNFKPPPLTNHSMSIYKNNIYIFGGVYNNEKVSNDLWKFDIEKEKWEQIITNGEIPLPVNEHSSCIINDKLYIYGGNDFSGIIYSSLYVLNLNTLIWYKLNENAEENGPGPRCGHSMTYLPKFNKLIIMGGDKNDYVVSDPHNFDTYENFNGEEVGTMIYELDIHLVDQFLFGPSDPQPLLQQVSPKKVKKVAASAAAAATDVGGKNYDRHARSFSAGPEDYATPHGSPSPERELNNKDGLENDFVEVEVPSGTISQTDHEDGDDEERINPYDSIDHSQIEPINNGYGDESRRRSLDPKLDEPVNGGVSGVGVAAAFAAAGAAGSAAGHSEGIIHNNFSHDTLGDEERDERPTYLERPSFVNHEDEQEEDESHYPEPTTNYEIHPVEKSFEKQQPQPPQNDSKVKQIISELTNELNNLKISTKEQMQNASETIENLKNENLNLQTNHSKQLQEQNQIINELKSSIDPNFFNPDLPNETNLSELNRYKLERLELNNKILYLEQENSKLNEKFIEFEPFMNNQIGELETFQKVIKVQEEQIEKLSHQVKDQEIINKEINDWKIKYDNLNLEFENYKAIHNDDNIEISEEPEQNEFSDNRSILSTAKSRKDISTQLENLVNLWNIKHPSTREVSPSITPENNPIVNKLQQQINDLLRISKQNEESSKFEIESLKENLQTKIQNLKQLEDNYKESLQSVNNTSKALKLNQNEILNQRNLLEKLIKENNELKIFKKAASGGASSRSPIINSESATPGEPLQENEEDDVNVINNAHYNMKIKDLEADLYILKQERDQLKDNVTSLQKQLYLSSNN
ncbi:KEL2 [Candida pseudojiufengensis]|uniref:KEL2 n=1 Tax=Candida pseudojiufengensis TaxID=497109 RepID=UPI0022241090|nr:KEL2 [Candida pseudojiufengensis]KAI5966306.1 KEL2 [Candida pseudojiufengensis]